MLHRATAACFDTWLDAACERRRQRALLGRALQRLTRRRQAAALASWRTFALTSGRALAVQCCAGRQLLARSAREMRSQTYTRVFRTTF